MANFYDIIDRLKSEVEELSRFNTTTFGQLDAVDLNRQDIFPLCHIVPQTVTIGTPTSIYQFTVHVLDIVDFNKDDVRRVNDPYLGTDNLQDVLSDTLLSMERVLDSLRRGDAFRDLFQLEGEPVCTPFFESQTNRCAGWSIELSVRIANASTTDGIC